jgi:uncharacterized protein DUF2645
MNLRRTIYRLMLTIYAGACALAVFVLSIREHEDMVGEQLPGEPPMTICSIPPAADSDIPETAGFAALLILPLLALGLALFLRGDRWNIPLGLGLFLLIFWVHQFFTRTLLC